MLIYILLFLYLIFLFWLENSRELKIKSWFVLTTFLILFLVAGFRHYSVGNDTVAYKSIFERNAPLPALSEYFSSRFELGFLYLNKFIHSQITTNYSIYLAIYSFWTLALTIFVIKKESKNFYLSLILYYTLGIYTATMNTLRVSFGISFIFLAYYLMKRNKHVAAIASIILASSFHLSGLAFFLVYLFRNIRIGKVGLALAGAFSLLGYVGVRGIIENILGLFTKYEAYTQSSSYGDSAKVAAILGAIIIILVFLWGEHVFRNVTLTKEENFLRNIVILGTVLSVMAIQTVTIARIVAYFYNFIVLYIPLIVSKIPEGTFVEKRRKIIVTVSMIALFGSRFFVVLIFRPEWNIIVPYRSTILDFLFAL